MDRGSLWLVKGDDYIKEIKKVFNDTSVNYTKKGSVVKSPLRTHP